MITPARLLAPLLALALLTLPAATAFAQNATPASQAQPEPDPDEASAPPQSTAPGQPASTAPSTPGAPGSGEPDAASTPSATLPDGATFEARVRASAAAAEGMQGPLDGGWTVRTTDGQALYGLQLVDTGSGALEGAWRDMRHPGGADARGLVASLDRVGDALTVRFYPHGGGAGVVVQLQSFGDNIWTGEMTDAGSDIPVSLIRNEARPTADYSNGRPRPVIMNSYAPHLRYVAPPHERERGGRHGRGGREERGHGGRHGSSRGGGRGSGHGSSSHGKGHGGSAHASHGKGGGSSHASGGKKKKKR